MAAEPVDKRVSRLAQSVSDSRGLLHVDCLLVSSPPPPYLPSLSFPPSLPPSFSPSLPPSLPPPLSPSLPPSLPSLPPSSVSLSLHLPSLSFSFLPYSPLSLPPSLHSILVLTCVHTSSTFSTGT